MEATYSLYRVDAKNLTITRLDSALEVPLLSNASRHLSRCREGDALFVTANPSAVAAGWNPGDLVLQRRVQPQTKLELV